MTATAGSRVNTDAMPSIRALVEILRDLSTQTEPAKAVAAFGKRFRELRPVEAFVSVSRRGLPEGYYKITRSFKPDEVSRMEAQGDWPNPWRDWQKLDTHTGGFIGRCLEDPCPQLYHDIDLSGDPVLGDRFGEMRCVTAIPVYDDTEALNWSFRFLKDPRGYSLHDLEQDTLTTNLFGGVTRNLVNLQRVRELNDRLAQQLQQIATIQQGLLPKKLPKVPGLAVATSYLTSDDAGGDYYDFFKFPCGSLGILIADVSGHGPAAATVMAMLRAILHCYEVNDPSPDLFMQYANDRLIRSGLDGSFITAFFAVYDPKRTTLTYARCGHNIPRLYRAATGHIEQLEADGSPPLGILPEIESRSAAIKLEPGDLVCLYTDGITEAFNPEHDDMFGNDRLDASILAATAPTEDAKPASPDAVIERIHADLYAFTGVRTREDDQTLVVFGHEPGLHGEPQPCPDEAL